MEQAGCAWTMDKPPASITTQTESKSTFQTRERALEVEANVESQLFFFEYLSPWDSNVVNSISARDPGWFKWTGSSHTVLGNETTTAKLPCSENRRWIRGQKGRNEKNIWKGLDLKLSLVSLNVTPVVFLRGLTKNYLRRSNTLLCFYPAEFSSWTMITALAKQVCRTMTHVTAASLFSYFSKYKNKPYFTCW